MPELGTFGHITTPPMTCTKTISQIRKRLDEAEAAKTTKDKISALTLIKILVEGDLERLKRESDKKKAAYDAKTLIIKKALKQFLAALDKIYSKHNELGDTDVREQMYRVIYKGFIQPQPGYSLPEKFGLFSDRGNSLVRAALQAFLTHPEVMAASRALKTSEDRFAAFQDWKVKTTEGTIYSEYFGYSKQVRVA
jgi:hypothetical protein